MGLHGALGQLAIVLLDGIGDVQVLLQAAFQVGWAVEEKRTGDHRHVDQGGEHRFEPLRAGDLQHLGMEGTVGLLHAQGHVRPFAGNGVRHQRVDTVQFSHVLRGRALGGEQGCVGFEQLA